jgi:hypothetical protein
VYLEIISKPSGVELPVDEPGKNLDKPFQKGKKKCYPGIYFFNNQALSGIVPANNNRQCNKCHYP